MNRSRLGILVVALALWPTGAYAAAGWWAWLEELSGPGPFHGLALGAPVLCSGENGLVPCTPASGVKRLVFVTVSTVTSGHNLRFKDLPDTPDNRREVHVLQVSGSYMFRLHPAVDVGVGAGTMRFSGEGFEPLWRVTLIPANAAVRPFTLIGKWRTNPWAQVVRGEFETSFVMPGFTAAQFGTPASTFSVGPEFLTRAAVVIDFGPLVWR
ncbi:MAG: hypothetical protein ACJ731_06960 [Vicinamibacterales bacterium]